MRLWSLHPRYLDAKGLVALWREALLAQKVLGGATKGYRNHPQLYRFRQQQQPLVAIAAYLRAVQKEAESRGYEFDMSKIGQSANQQTIPVTSGQLGYELEHLKAKLRIRDAAAYQRLEQVKIAQAHPLFKVIHGPVEPWEVLAEKIIFKISWGKFHKGGTCVLTLLQPSRRIQRKVSQYAVRPCTLE